MKRNKKTGMVDGALAAGAHASTAYPTGFERHPDVPLHPLDGPIPTD